MRHNIADIRKLTEEDPISYVRYKGPSDDQLAVANRIRAELNELALKAADKELVVLRAKWQAENERLKADREAFEREIDEAFEELEEEFPLTRMVLKAKVFSGPSGLVRTAVQDNWSKNVVRRFMSFKHFPVGG